MARPADVAVQLRGHDDGHAGEHREGAEEHEEHAEDVLPTLPQRRLVLGRGHRGGGHGAPVGQVPGARVVSEEGRGLDHHEHGQAQQHEQEGNQEAVEPEVAWADLETELHACISAERCQRRSSLYLESYDRDVDGGREDAAQRLARHHAAHVVGRELARHPDKAALEDGGADVEEHHDEERGQQEGGLPAVRVHPRHDQHRDEEGRHHRQRAQQPHVQSEPLPVHKVQDDENRIWYVRRYC